MSDVLTKATTRLVVRMRSPEGRKLAEAALDKQMREPALDLGTLMKARVATRAMLAGERATADQYEALDVLIPAVQPKPQRDEVLHTLQRQYLDGDEAEREQVTSVLKEMARIAVEESQPRSLFAVAKMRKPKLGGMFF
jgi:hypothetical protein